MRIDKNKFIFKEDYSERDEFLQDEPPGDSHLDDHNHNDIRTSHQTAWGIKKDSESTRITVFLIFEFALLFGLLAAVNLVATVTSAGVYAGTEYLFLFLLCLVSAPFGFAYVIHVFDELFKWMSEERVYGNMWLRSIVALIVGSAIGAGMSFYFIHPFIGDFRGLSPLPPQGLDAACYDYLQQNQTIWISESCSSFYSSAVNFTAFNTSYPECVRYNATTHTTWYDYFCW